MIYISIIFFFSLFIKISPGFIAGVTNPTYEEHTAWWDILCNIDTGKITVSKDIQVNPTGRKQSLAYFEEGFASLAIGRTNGVNSNSSLKSDDKHNKEKDYDAEFMNDVNNNNNNNMKQ